MHVATWFERLATTPGEPRDRLAAALATLAPDAATVFTPLAGEAALVDAGILAGSMREQEAAWRRDGRRRPSPGTGCRPCRRRRPRPTAAVQATARPSPGCTASSRPSAHADPGATW